MNNPDCGNQRTGQPRWAQLMANTWNCSPSMWRTQQGVLSVSPSQGFEIGLRNIANMVWPSGKSLKEPSATQRLYFPCCPRRMGEARYPITGVARIRTAKPFKRAPILARKSRRETSCSSLTLLAFAAGSLNAHLRELMNWRETRRADCENVAPQ